MGLGPILKGKSFYTLASLVLLLLSACASPPSPVPEKAVAETSPEVEKGPAPLTVHQLLYRAEEALSRDRLRQPAGDNAYDWYQQVLVRLPDHAEALQGLDRISQRYLELAEKALQVGDDKKAEILIERALTVTATQEQVGKLRQRYSQPEFADNEYPVKVEHLNARNTEARQRLSDIASVAKSSDSRFLIIARSDDEGRWMYQQMRVAVVGYRLRGNIQLGRFPRVILIDLDNR